jgi:hypothetical protein
MNSLSDRLKTLNTDGGQLEDLMELRTGCLSLIDMYAKYTEEVPDWLLQADRILDAEIRGRVQDSLRKRLMAVDSKLETLKTPDERRSDLARERNRILLKMGQPVPMTSAEV